MDSDGWEQGYERLRRFSDAQCARRGGRTKEERRDKIGEVKQWSPVGKIRQKIVAPVEVGEVMFLAV